MEQSLDNPNDVELTKKFDDDFISTKIESHCKNNNDEAFFIADLSDIVHKYKTWKRELPRVEPFYAVKCNDDIGVLSVLAQLGTGFDCASKAEIDQMMNLNVAPNRVIYANPCKQNSHIRHAAKHGVTLMTFDNICELHKIKANHPNAKLVIRILPPDGIKAMCPFGKKFGAHSKDVPKMLKTAKDLGLNVVGVSFHVGSSCYDPTAFPLAIASASAAFDMGQKAGFQFDLLDIGGGYPGQKAVELSFEELCGPLRSALDIYFPESKGVRIIAEPGRYFVASAFTLAVRIIAKRTVLPEDDSEDCKSVDRKFMYYLNDGIYGSFNCLIFDVVDLKAELVRSKYYADEPRFACSIWGPTCDGIDLVKSEIQLPELEIGDWLIYRDMGAYTMCAASSYNGIPKTRTYHVIQESAWIQMQTNLTKSHENY